MPIGSGPGHSSCGMDRLMDDTLIDDTLIDGALFDGTLNLRQQDDALARLAREPGELVQTGAEGGPGRHRHLLEDPGECPAPVVDDRSQQLGAGWGETEHEVSAVDRGLTAIEQTRSDEPFAQPARVGQVDVQRGRDAAGIHLGTGRNQNESSQLWHGHQVARPRDRFGDDRRNHARAPHDGVDVVGEIGLYRHCATLAHILV